MPSSYFAENLVQKYLMGYKLLDATESKKIDETRLSRISRKHIVMSYELKHIHGVPYYLDGSTVRTFEMDGGKPAAECVAIGTYDATTDTLTYFADWIERIQPRLDAFRTGIMPQERDKLRDTIVKPQKQRKTTRTPRKSSTRAKSATSE